MTAPAIGNVQDTARLTAAFRAREAGRADALFCDPCAPLLAGPWVAGVEGLPGVELRASAAAVRTALFDHAVMTAAREGFDAVICLGAGLDARPWRLPLPASLRWFDLDLAPVLAAKREALSGLDAACAYTAVTVDLVDPGALGWALGRIDGQAGRALVLAEGLLVYLSPEQIASLASQLARAHAPAAWWTELVSADGAASVASMTGGNVATYAGCVEALQQNGWRVDWALPSIDAMALCGRPLLSLDAPAEEVEAARSVSLIARLLPVTSEGS